MMMKLVVFMAWMALLAPAGLVSAVPCCSSFDGDGNPHGTYTGDVDCNTERMRFTWRYRNQNQHTWQYTKGGKTCSSPDEQSLDSVSPGQFRFRLRNGVGDTGCDEEVEVVLNVVDERTWDFTCDLDSCDGEILCTCEDCRDDDDDDDGFCFSESATATVNGKGPVAMKDLHVGDWILTSTSIEKQKYAYQPIYAFGHHQKQRTMEFLQIFTEGGENAPLEVTPEHLIFVQGQANPIRADSIEVGDELLHRSGSGTVNKISSVTKQGYYAPFTPAGNLVVDGIVASSYVDLSGLLNVNSQHQYVHMALAPLRLFCMGIFPSLCNESTMNDGTATDGKGYYVYYGMKLHQWADQQNIAVQCFVFMFVMIAAGACFVVETVLGGAKFAPLLLVHLTVVAWRLGRKHPNPAVTAAPVKEGLKNE